MALGIITDEIFEREVLSLELKRGRGEGRKNIPPAIRALAAMEAISGASQKEVGEALGISPNAVHAYKHDATSNASYNKPNEELAKSNESVRNQIAGTAFSKLMLALNSIGENELLAAKLQTKSAVARDMSSIVKNVMPDSSEGSGKIQNNVIIYRPRQKEEDDYEVIDVSSKEF